MLGGLKLHFSCDTKMMQSSCILSCDSVKISTDFKHIGTARSGNKCKIIMIYVFYYVNSVLKMILSKRHGVQFLKILSSIVRMHSSWCEQFFYEWIQHSFATKKILKFQKSRLSS